MSKAFENSLSSYLESKPRPTMQERRLQNVLALPKDNPRRKRVLSNLEKAAADKLTESGRTVDFNAVDWGTLLTQLLAFIKAILSLFQ